MIGRSRSAPVSWNRYAAFFIYYVFDFRHECAISSTWLVEIEEVTKSFVDGTAVEERELGLCFGRVTERGMSPDHQALRMCREGVVVCWPQADLQSSGSS